MDANMAMNTQNAPASSAPAPGGGNPGFPALPVTQPTPAPAATPVMESGGSTGGGGIKGWFRDINLVDVTVSAFVIGAVLYTVHYYKFMMMMEKTGYADLSGRVSKMEAELAAAKKKTQMNAAGSMNSMRGRRPMMRLA
jgi:hypothetical protein